LNERLSKAAQPQLGRFLSRDPIGHAGGLNLYEYGANNPVSMTDPNGLVPPEGVMDRRLGIHVPASTYPGYNNPAGGMIVAGAFTAAIAPFVLPELAAAAMANPTTALGAAEVGLGAVLGYDGPSPTLALPSIGRVTPSTSSWWRRLFKRKPSYQRPQLNDLAPCGSKITLEAAEEAAKRNGLDVGAATIRGYHNPGPNVYGAVFHDASGAIYRELGKPVIGLTKLGLSDARTAVATIAHELKHIEQSLSGLKPPLAELPAKLAEWAAWLGYK